MSLHPLHRSTRRNNSYKQVDKARSIDCRITVLIGFQRPYSDPDLISQAPLFMRQRFAWLDTLARTMQASQSGPAATSRHTWGLPVRPIVLNRFQSIAGHLNNCEACKRGRSQLRGIKISQCSPASPIQETRIRDHRNSFIWTVPVRPSASGTEHP
jgi:hypothetical protein